MARAAVTQDKRLNVALLQAFSFFLTLHFVLIRALRILCGVWEGVNNIVLEGFDRVLKGFMRVAGFRVQEFIWCQGLAGLKRSSIGLCDYN